MPAYCRPVRPAAALVLAVGALAALPACGGSSKPGYCSGVSTLKSSVADLDLKGGVSGITSQVGTIKANADDVVSSAKADFPTQTKAISSSVTTLQDAVKALPSSPSAANVLSIGADVSAVVTAVKGFTDATSSKC
jgi:hypothetical protein